MNKFTGACIHATHPKKHVTSHKCIYALQFDVA